MLDAAAAPAGGETQPLSRAEMAVATPRRLPCPPEFQWMPDWTGETAVVVAAGPSATDEPLMLAKDRARVMVVNDSWRLAGFADALYACDAKWYIKSGGVPLFGGLKITRDDAACTAYPEVRLIHTDLGASRPLFERAGHVCWGGNSGMQAVNLVAQWGVARILLVGFDMTLAGGIHWHGPHGKGLANPESAHVDRWRHLMDVAAPIFAARGIEVINCSPRSALEKYPKRRLAECLA